MSVANAGLAVAATAPQAEDATRAPELDDLEEEHPIAPDQFDPRYETTRWERWAYYCYYIGNNGLTLFNFAPTSFQDLLYEAAGDSERLQFLGSYRTINSIVLLANGISFAIQVVLFLFIGSMADYGRWRPWILVFWSIVAFAIGFAWLGVHTEDKWPTATGLYMVGLIAYQMCITFWTAAFPGLARNEPEMRVKAEQYERGEISRDDYDFADMMQRNRIYNVAFIMQSAGEIIILAVLVGILFALDVNASAANNLWGLSVLIAYATGVWILLAIPWFILEKKRPGQMLPPGMNLVSVGFWNIWRALVQIWELKQSLLYLIGYFLLGDSLNTTVTVIATLQNTVVSYNTLTLTYLLIVGIAAQGAGILGYWLIQKRFRLSTKTMFDFVMLGILLLDGWGMIGIWTHKFGFHNEWEFWLYQVIYGIFVCQWYAYSQTMISEVTPRGKEFLFFSLYSIMGKTSAFIGPIVSSAIIDASPSGNNSLPFYFLFGLSLLSFLLLFFFVDLKKSRREQEVFLAKEKAAKERRASFVAFSTGRPVEDHDVGTTRSTKAGRKAALGNNADTGSGSSKSLEAQEMKT
ncbi:UMF1 family MFS transporter [Exophiala viscosa]|uniref:Autophagy-related protein n=1 Tax=Exophiala viscosa TaxID=2486360 RepID=A0AAN6DL87_9EURO|nr:UMF1 family MFS transporter [Exophiala viscosa]